MKKFTRIIAVLMAAIMAMTAMCITSSAANQSAFTKINAIACDDSFGPWFRDYGVINIKNGNWLEYRNIDFGSGANSVTFNIAAPDRSTGFNIYIDSLDGQLIGRCPVQSTGSWDTWKDVSYNIMTVTGVHNVYLKFGGAATDWMHLSWFRFNSDSVSDTVSAYKKIEAESFFVGYDMRRYVKGGGVNYYEGNCVSEILNSYWMGYKNIDFGNGAKTFIVNVASDALAVCKIEIHLDKPTGKLIGTCQPERTLGWDKWKNFSCNVSGASGVHDVYFVFSGVGYNCMNIDYFQFTADSSAVSYTGYWGITLKKGSSTQLWIDTNSKVTYSTSNKSIATVTSAGKVTAKAKGTAIITAKYGNKTQKIKIKVTA